MKKPIVIQSNLPTERCIEIWLKRMFSVCKQCGALLSNQNSYSRDDTDSKLHTYCKPCYIKIQQDRHESSNVKNTKLFILINKKKIVTFDSEQEKQNYIRERASLSKFSRSCEEYSSVVGCNEYWTKESPVLCDQCGGLLKRDERGDLVCTVCYLVCDTLSVISERNLSFNKSNGKRSIRDSYFNEQSECDDGAVDVYYQRAYSKSRKL